MESTESVRLKLLDTQSISKISEWLAENLQSMQQTSKQIMKLIGGGSNSSAHEIDGFDLKRPQLLDLLREFSSMCQSLAEQYSWITGESQQATPSNKGSLYETSELKLQPRKLDHNNVYTDQSLSPRDGSFETSLKGSAESSTLLLASESEYFTSAIDGHIDTVEQINGLSQQQKKSKPVIEPICMNFSSEEVDADDGAKRSKCRSYEELIGTVMQYELELKVLNQKLQQSEVEITMLKSALNGSDSAVHDLQVQLEAVETDIEKKDGDLELAKGKILHLESRMLGMEIHIADSNCKTEILMKELNQAQEKLEKSNEDAAILTAGLNLERQKIVELQERISMYHKDVLDRENGIVRLQSALSEAERKNCMEKEQLMMQWDLQYKQLETNFRQREDEIKELHHSLVQDMQYHISNSKVGIEEREARIDSLNKELDRMKLRHDMVVAERDGLNARVQTLLAELSCRDNHIKELTAGTISGLEDVGKLKLRVQELENEVEMQKIVISDEAEKKREAIRQLCFSLEHSRAGYHELREAFLRHNKRHSVLAS